MKNTKQAVIWITDILDKLKFKYQIHGGFAMHIYGSKRELEDIDIELISGDISELKESVNEYIVFGPDKYTDGEWDLTLMTLNYMGQDIDICDQDAMIFNKFTGIWEKRKSIESTVVMKEIFGKVLPVESLEATIAYKKKLGREVDIEDVSELGK